ncbi:MAG: hypothetical protein IIA44_13250, partial [Acidobacteria bacterium]|nr:hypothetical protein [Acidobacteriota bacterium]
LFAKLNGHFNGDLAGRLIAVWGLSFKPGTDDIREAPSLVLIDRLLEAKALVRVHDPVATDNVRAVYGDRIVYCDHHYETLDDADALGERGAAVLDRVNALLSDSTITALGGSIQDLQALLSELSDVTRSESGTIKDMIASLNRAAQGLESMTAAGPETGAELASAVTYADSLLQHMNRASVRLDRAAGSLEVIMARMERGEGTLGQLSTNDSLYHTLTATVESVRLLMVDLRENPGRYINLSIF